MASVSVEPGTVGRQPIVDPWPIWDDIERASQAPNGDKPFPEVWVILMRDICVDRVITNNRGGALGY